MPGDGRLVVISPHLDDAVLGCADLLRAHPGAVVVTAFAGRPAAYPELTSWDARAGFEAGDDVVAARRQEDTAALRVLGAQPCWLDFPDPQYGEKPSREALAEALARALDELAPSVVVAPLGMFHDDHILTGDAALDVLAGRPTLTWLAYADAIYRRVPELLAKRLASLRDAGFGLQAVDASGQPASQDKRRAVACYRSQVRALEHSWDGGVSDAFEPEQYWRIAAPAQQAARQVGGAGDGQHGTGD